jgi:hypothetical protein
MLPGAVFGQTESIVISVKDPRPLAAASLEIERRSGIVVNYEDLRYERSEDLEDVTDRTLTPEQRSNSPNARIVVPRGGEIRFPITVDTKTKRIGDLSAALTAVTVAIRAWEPPAGRFEVRTYDGVLFVEPSQLRADGITREAPSVLSARITIPVMRRTAMESLNSIVDQVSKASGFRIVLGTVPMGTLAVTEVSIGANNEPAKFVLAKLFAAMRLAESSQPVVPSAGLSLSLARLSYRLLFEPQLRYYALNIHPVQVDENRPTRSLPTSPPSSGDRPGYKKQP